MKRDSAWNQVYHIVDKIPRGRVMTYGQISLYMENLSAQAVGWAMKSCPQGLPWHRVVNASGGCSTARLPHLPPGLQQALLEKEGVSFQEDGTIDLKVYRWRYSEPGGTNSED